MQGILQYRQWQAYSEGQGWWWMCRNECKYFIICYATPLRQVFGSKRARERDGRRNEWMRYRTSRNCFVLFSSLFRTHTRLPKSRREHLSLSSSFNPSKLAILGIIGVWRNNIGENWFWPFAMEFCELLCAWVSHWIESKLNMKTAFDICRNNFD